MTFRRSMIPFFLSLSLLLLLPLAPAQGTPAALGSAQALPLGSYAHASATAINNAGQIVGSASDVDAVYLGPIYWASANATPVALAGGLGMRVEGINDAGLMVGVDDITGTAIYWSGPRAKPFALRSTQGTVVAVAVNNIGAIVGLIATTQGVSVVEWDSVAVAPVVKASLAVSAEGIGEIAVNDVGDIVFQPGVGGRDEYYLGANATMPVPFPVSGIAEAVGLDNFGNVVPGFPSYLAAYNGAVVDASNANWFFEGINDIGEVVGSKYKGLFVVPELWRFVNPGADQTVTPDASGQAQVTLSGSAVLPDGDAATTYTWSEDGTVLGSGSSLSVSLAAGKHTIVLTAGVGNISMSARTQVTVQAITLEGVANLIQQEQTALASDIGAVQTNTDTLLSSGAKESSLEALGGQLNAISSTLAALTASNGSLANLASGQAAIQAGLAALQKSQAAKANGGVERALAEDQPLVVDELPPSAGGVLDQVAALAKLRVSEAGAAGISVGRLATVLLTRGDQAVTAKQYERAFRDYAEAYRQIGVGGGHRAHAGDGGHR